MRVAVLRKNGFTLEDRDRPKFAENEVLVKTRYCGICEGDLAAFRRATSAASPIEEVLGHEGTGTVVGAGAAVDGFPEGTEVTVLGGAYADYFVARPDQLVKLPSKVDPAWALGEPVACCVHGAGRSGVKLGDRVAVVGCGFMGLIWMQLARLQGAGRVCAIDVIDWRLDVARRLGADEVRAPDQVGDDEFDVVVEAAGSESAIELGTRIVRQHGRLIIVAYHQSNDGIRNVSMKTWNFKAIDVVNAHVRNHAEKRRAMETSIALLDSGRIQTRDLVTQYPLPEVGKAFEDLLARKKGLFKAELSA